MIAYKLNRLFNPRSGRLLDVAVDHGFFGEPAFLTGITDMASAIDTLVDAAPDAIEFAPARMCERVSVPATSVRVHFLACARLSLALGATHLRPCRSPLAVRVKMIRTLAAAESLKRKVVPIGARRADTAVAFLPTRKRLLVSLAALSPSDFSRLGAMIGRTGARGVLSV